MKKTLKTLSYFLLSLFFYAFIFGVILKQIENRYNRKLEKYYIESKFIKPFRFER